MSWSTIGDVKQGTSAGEQLGTIVHLNITGTRMAVGSINGSGTGSVEIFDYNSGGDTWDSIGTITGIEDGDEFGSAVKLSNNGGRITIGAPGYSSNLGAVQVYQYNGGTSWTQLGSNITGSTGSRFGTSVATDRHTNTIAIGAPFHINRGSISVYSWNGSSWSIVNALEIGDNTQDQFGLSVSICDNGDIIAAGAPDPTGTGYVKVFQNNGAGWDQLGSNLDGENIGDEFGHHVDESTDGYYVIIGAPENSNGRGKVYVYNYSGTEWSLYGDTFVGGSVDVNYGDAVAIAGDATVIAYSGTASGPTGEGLVIVREYDSGTNEWDQVGAPITGNEAGDLPVNGVTTEPLFGASIALGSDSSSSAVIAIGAPLHELPTGAADRGYVRTYESTDLTFTNNCFIAGSMVKTDQGDVAIEKITTENTVNGKKVKRILSRLYNDELIKIKKDAFDTNVPDRDTHMTKNHKIKFGEKYIKAKTLEKYHIKNKKKILKVENNQVRVYNLQFEEYQDIVVNNMETESLHPTFDFDAVSRRNAHKRNIV
jgi:hypothetical protein